MRWTTWTLEMLPMCIDHSLAFYEDTAREADRLRELEVHFYQKAMNALGQKRVAFYFMQPVGEYVAEFYFPEKGLVCFSYWEEHEHGEAYFRELRMKESIEAMDLKIQFFSKSEVLNFVKSLD